MKIHQFCFPEKKDFFFKANYSKLIILSEAVFSVNATSLTVLMEESSPTFRSKYSAFFPLKKIITEKMCFYRQKLKVHKWINGRPPLPPHACND